MPTETDERTPLLLVETDVEAQIINTTKRSDLSAQPDIDQEQQDDDDDDSEDSDKWTPWDISGAVLLCVLGLVVVGMFAKGWMDAQRDGVEFDFPMAFKSALGGGLAGALAMTLQVLILMPLRTVMVYQYRYGNGTGLRSVVGVLWREGAYGETRAQALERQGLPAATGDMPSHLNSEECTTQLGRNTLEEEGSMFGGVARFYSGMLAALIQGPLSRFGDTAANAGVLVLLKGMDSLPSLVKTGAASLTAAIWRMGLMPVDTVKTTLQAEGSNGWGMLKERIRMYGIFTLWYGAFATGGATFVGNYPWFATFNYLDDIVPHQYVLIWKLLRSAAIGFIASVISDTISNSLRVIKTFRQVNAGRIGYVASARAIVRQDGLKGLFVRGLSIRIIANGAQGVMFAVLWRVLLDEWEDETNNGG